MSSLYLSQKPEVTVQFNKLQQSQTLMERSQKDKDQLNQKINQLENDFDELHQFENKNNSLQEQVKIMKEFQSQTSLKNQKLNNLIQEIKKENNFMKSKIKKITQLGLESTDPELLPKINQYKEHENNSYKKQLEFSKSLLEDLQQQMDCKIPKTQQFDWFLSLQKNTVSVAQLLIDIKQKIEDLSDDKNLIESLQLYNLQQKQ